jgi:CheY-like chemotaxis protein
MAIFGFGKDKKEGGGSPELVLAYLEDAQRVRAPFVLAGPRRTETPAILQSLDEAEGTATFQLTGPLIADKGATIDLVFIQEGLRLGASARLVENRPGVAVVDLPEALELKERRGMPRARVNPKEGATVTALTGLFEGVGITGVLENVSESGARVRVEKGMSIKGEKRLHLGEGLVPVGQAFILVKLNKVPKCPGVMELEGKAVYLDTGGAGLSMGLKFNRTKADVAAGLRGMVASRTSAIPTTLPPKARRTREAPSAGLLADEPLVPAARQPAPPPKAPEPVATAPKPEPAKPVAEAPAAPQAPPMPPAPPAPQALATHPLPASAAQAPLAPAGVHEPEPENPGLAARSATLLRLKKRSRAVVALSRTAAFEDILKGFLQEDGYGRVLTTLFPDEVLEFLRQPNLGVLLLDGNMSVVESLEYVQKLRNAFLELPPIILAAEDISTAVVLAARRKGVTQLVVRPYALDAAFSALLSEQLH